MATSDSSTLKRSKDRRKSIKERRSSKSGINRSRTREIDASGLIHEEEDQ